MVNLKRICTPLNVPRLLLAAAIAIAAVASSFLTGDGLLRAQFDVAFEDRALTSVVSESRHTPSVQLVAASEDYWLGHASKTRATLASWGADQPVSVGDLITLTTEGVKRALEVVSVKQLPPGALATSAADGSSVLVTLRPAEQAPGRAIHLLLDGTEELSPLASLFERAREL